MKTNTKYSNIAIKLILSSLILAWLTIGNTFAEELTNTIPSTTRPPVNYTPVEAVEKENVNIDENTTNTWTTSWIENLISKVNADFALNNNKVLLIQDYLPWQSDANVEELNNLGIPYDSINSNSLPNIDLNNYKAIIITSDQPAWFYEIIRQHKARWDKFVENGWLLVSHSWDHGWQDWDSNWVLPGKVLKTTYYSQPLWMRDSNHPVITWQVLYNSNIGWQNPWYFNNWYWSTHWYFNNLQDLPNWYTDVIDINTPLLPTYIDYKYGQWRVLATMQTLEFWYKYLWKQEILRNEFLIVKNYSRPLLSTNIPDYKNTNISNNWYILWNTNVWIPSIPTYVADLWDPVNISTWDFWYDNNLLSYKWVWLNYNFKIKYSNQVDYDGNLWHNWSHSYNQMIYSGNSGSLIYLDENFSPREFVKISDNLYENKLFRAKLAKENNLYIITFDNWNKIYFNDSNKLSKIEDKNWNNLVFEYDNDKNLVKTIDTLWREINYLYNTGSRLEKIIDFNSKEVSFNYNENNDLISIKIWKNNNAKEIKFEYISGNEVELLNHNMTKLIDSKNQVYVENIYDEWDKVINQKYGDWTVKYNYTIDPITSKIIKNNVENRNWIKTEYSFDDKWNTISRKVTTDSWVVEFKFEYDSDWRITKDIKPNWNSIEYSYDDKWRLLTQKDIWGTSRITSYEYNSNFDTPTKIIKSNWLVIENTLDQKWNVIKSVVDNNSEKLETSYEYNDKWQLIKTINSRWLKTSLEYDGNWNITKISKKDSSLLAILWSSIDTSFEYDNNGNITKIIDPNWNSKSINYNEFDQIIKSISPLWITSSFEYDGNGNKVKSTLKLDDWSSLEASNTYDILDHITEVNSPISKDLTAKIEYEYDSNENIIKTIYPNWSIKNFTYNEFDEIIKIIQEWKEAKYEYDNNWNIIIIIDSKWNFKKIEYNLFNEPIKITDSVWAYTTLGYDTNWNVVKMVVYSKDNKLLSKQEKSYDLLGNIVKQLDYNLTNNQILTTNYKYNKWLLAEKTDTRWNKTSLSYDIYWNNTEITDSSGNKQVLSYDNNWNLVSKKVIQSNSKTTETKYVFDKENRLISSSFIASDSEVIKTSYEYNNLNQIIEKKDWNWSIAKYEYNYIWKVTKKIETVNSKTISTSYEYDISGNLTAIIDWNWNKTGYVYDNLNRLIKEAYVDNKEVNYEYDSLGNIIKKTDPNWNIISNTYDSLNRLIERNITLGTGVEWVTKENYSYDELGRLISASDNRWGNLVFSYDSFGNLVSETNNGKEVKYSYDELGNLLNTLYPSSRNIGRTYDSIWRLTSIKNWNDIVKAYVYDWLEQTSEVNSNNTKTNYSYDALGRLKELTNIWSQEVKKWKNTNMQESIINKYTFNYDNNSNILSNWQDSYSYDEINRLTQTIYKPTENNKSTTESFVYDFVWNRITSNLSEIKESEKNKKEDKIKADISNYTSNTLNQYISLDKTRFTYDNNWNLIKDWKQIYTYDYRNRLIKVTNKDWEIKSEFGYDILGRRTSKTTYNDDDEARKIIKYTYSNQDIIQEDLYEKDDWKEKLKSSKEYVYWKWIDDLIVMIVITWEWKKKTESKYFYQKDQLWSIVTITDKDWKTVKEYRYDVFGKAYEKKDKSYNWKEYNRADIDNTRLFIGREFDKEIWLYYYRARYYSSEIGRFINRDPIGQVDNVNLYSYVGNNPVKFTDPIGLASKAFLSIFNQAETDFSDVSNLSFGEKLDKWSWLELWKYDLTFHNYLWTKDNPTTVFEQWEKNNNIVLANNGNNPIVNVWGNVYELWQVSNILVWFSAYNIWYSEEFLNLWSTWFNATGWWNGLYEDSFDKLLYHIWYLYAKWHKEENTTMTTGQIQWIIALGVAYRQQAANSPNIFDYTNQILDSVLSWVRK